MEEELGGRREKGAVQAAVTRYSTEVQYQNTDPTVQYEYALPLR